MLETQLGWVDEAACGKEPNLDLKDFFPEPGSMVARHIVDMCLGCPVRRDCVRHAIEQGHTAGWFGGLSADARSAMTLEDAAGL